MANGTEVGNPFQIPNMTPDSHQPLRPWKELEHDEYYVPVDGTETAFNDFSRQTSSAQNLVDHGRLVVVVGGRGCGKTSLINRCTAQMSALLTGFGVTPVIADLTREGMGHQSSDERKCQVCTTLIDQLALAQRLDERVLTELASRQDTPKRAYSYLSQALAQQADHGDNLAVIALLPPTDLAQEINDYAQMVRARIMFFAESSHLDPYGGWQETLDRSSPAPPIVLGVSILEKKDGILFAGRRLTGHHEGGITPSISEATMDKLQSHRPALTIAQLQRLLHGVYEEVLERTPPVREVTFQDIAEYYFKRGTE